MNNTIVNNNTNYYVDKPQLTVKVVFWVKAISYTFFAHYFALPSNTTGWNPINRYHATTFLSLAPVFRFRLITVLLVSVLSRLRFVNGIVRVVVRYLSLITV
jgi:hypothetical protein